MPKETTNIPRAAEKAKAMLLACGVPEDEIEEKTPERMAKALSEMVAAYADGYAQHDAARITADTSRVTSDKTEWAEYTVVTDIYFSSLCRHHVLPFSGHCTVVYRNDVGPGTQYTVPGFSKIPRTVGLMASRLTLQEQLAKDIANKLLSQMERLCSGYSVAVALTAGHSCVGCRGARAKDARFTTYAYALSSKPVPSSKVSTNVKLQDLQTVLRSHHVQ